MDELDLDSVREQHQDDAVDFDGGVEGSFLLAETPSQRRQSSAGEGLHPHTEMVDGFLQVFVHDKQITFDEAHHVNPRRSPTGEIERDVTEKPAVVQDGEWKILAQTGIVSFATHMQNAGISANQTSRGFSFKIPIAGGRTQVVYLSQTRSDAEGDPIIQVITRCGDPSKTALDDLLRRNMTIPYGAIAIADLDGEECLVLVDTWLATSVQSIELTKAVFTLARVGDGLESSLHPEDRF